MTDVQTPPEGTEPETTVEPTIVPEPPIVTPAVDYEQKFKQSSAEAQLLLEQKKALEAKLHQINSSNPTDDELRAAHPTFDQYDELTKGVLRDQLATKKWRQQQELKEAEAEAERLWRSDLAALSTNPTYAHLSADGEFEKFANKYPKGVDLQTIADSYMVRNGKFPNATPPDDLPTPSGNEVLPAGSGGPRGPRKTGYTAEEVKDIRTNDPKRYQDLLEKGLIKIEID
jgi:hypothetical protein